MKTLKAKLVKAGFKVEAKDEYERQEFDTKEDAMKMAKWIEKGEGKTLFDLGGLTMDQGGNKYIVTYKKK